MIYYCADDYGLSPGVSRCIMECVNEGCLNKISCFPNFDGISSRQMEAYPDVSFGLHLNLVEGNALSDAKSIPLLADENGRFRHTFVGLLKLCILKKKQMEQQLRLEIKTQLLAWKHKFPDAAGLILDSHQHTHMIPLVFRVLMQVISEENLKVSYLRIPAEPIIPYLMVPSLYFSYSAVNLIKQWLLKLLWQVNKKQFDTDSIPTAFFMGILFSGHMDEKRVTKVLPHYIRLAKKKGKDIEVLFHPGAPDCLEVKQKKDEFSFLDFYLSPGRSVEYNTAKNLKNIMERGE